MSFEPGKVPLGAFAPARRIDFWSFGVLLYVMYAELLFESNATGPTVLPVLPIFLKTCKL